jgi:hypothetical protein
MKPQARAWGFILSPSSRAFLFLHLEILKREAREVGKHFCETYSAHFLNFYVQ